MQQRKSSDQNKVKRRDYMKGIGAAGLSAAAMNSFADSAEAAPDDAMRVDGDNVYLIFGVDTSSTDLKSWLKNHKDRMGGKSQQSSSQVIQYQDVSQVNVNQQKKAVAISIDGGKADAIQRTYQNNENTQAGSARSINANEEQKKQKFKDVKNTYIIFANETESREFSGWVVSDQAYKTKQTATAEIKQKQKVDQVNYSSQSAAIAVAKDSSYARAYQRSFQSNKNQQSATALAANIGDSDKQSANTSVKQWQDVNQLNVNKQGVAVAIAVGCDSTAKAWQISCQFNGNKQVADAKAVNFDPKSIEEFTASANMTGDYKDSKVKQSPRCSSQSNEQGAAASVSQFQDVSQKNISMQNAAVAFARDESEATATQASYQANLNTQVASATAVNLKEGTKTLYTVMEGKDVKGDNSWAVAYDNGNGSVSRQAARAAVEQSQYIQQLNINNQTSAVAIATKDGNASAEQLNYQLNKNIQRVESSATNTSDQRKRGAKNRSKGKKAKC